MAIVLIEEVLVGLEEVKIALEQAVTILEDIIEDMRPEIAEALQDVLQETWLHPLQTRLTAMNSFLEELAV